MVLEREGLITLWTEAQINAGIEREETIQQHLNTAQILLFLISAEFLASDYFASQIIQRAIERYEREETRIIPVLLRPASWQGALLHKLQPLPADGIPITSRKQSRDEALLDVTNGIRNVVEELTSSSSTRITTPHTQDKANNEHALYALPVRVWQSHFPPATMLCPEYSIVPFLGTATRSRRPPIMV